MKKGFFWSRLENALEDNEADIIEEPPAEDEAEGEAETPETPAEAPAEGTAEAEAGTAAEAPPEETPEETPPEVPDTTEKEGPDDHYVLCAYRRLADEYYYLYYTPASSVADFFESRFDAKGHYGKRRNRV